MVSSSWVTLPILLVVILSFLFSILWGNNPNSTPAPSSSPSNDPSGFPSNTPSKFPSTVPTASPISTPSWSPSSFPSSNPSTTPSVPPSGSARPSTSLRPSTSPSAKPSISSRPTWSSSPSSSPSISAAPSTSPVSFEMALSSGASGGLATNLTPQGAAVAPLNLICGPVERVLPHPVDADICFAAGTSGGVWRTLSCQDSSPVWDPIMDYEGTLEVNDLVFDLDDATGNTVVVALGRPPRNPTAGGIIASGLLKTTNALNDIPEWTVVDNQDGSFRAQGFRFNSIYANGDLMLAAGGAGLDPNDSDTTCPLNGIFRSIDAGQSWLNVFPIAAAFHIVQDSGNPERFYAAVSGFITRVCTPSDATSLEIVITSVDNGENWSLTTDLPFPDPRSIGWITTNLKISVDSNARVWAYKATRTANGVAYSDDNGVTWTALAPIPGPVISHTTATSLLASDDGAVFLGLDFQAGPFPNEIGAVEATGRLFRGIANDNGIWEHMTDSSNIAAIPGGGTASSSAPHGDSNDMAMRQDGSLLEGNAGGIVVRTSPTDNTGDWCSLCGNLQVFEIISVAYEPFFNTVIFGTESTGTILGTLGTEGSNEALTTGFGNVVMIDYTSNDDEVYYYYGSKRLSPFFRLTRSRSDGTITSEELSLPFTGTRADIGSGALNPADQTQLAVEGGARVNGTSYVAFSTDRGASFKSIETSHNDPNFALRAALMAWAWDGSILYTADGYSLGSCANGGGTLLCSPRGTIENTFSGRRVTSIAVDPLNAMNVLACSTEIGFGFELGINVYYSTDGGNTWADVTIGGSRVADAENGKAVAFMKIGSLSWALVGTNRGVYVDDGGIGKGWRLFANGLPTAPITALTVDETSNTLVVAVHGRGVWFLEKASNALESSEVRFRQMR